MGKAKLVKAQTGELACGNFEMKECGLAVSGKPSFDEWSQFGDVLARVDGAVHWWIGDWLNYGEGTWGEKYSQAMSDTGFSYSTLTKDKYVASQVQFCVRTQKLSWEHHKLIAPLSPKDQKKWLTLALKGDGKKPWSVHTLREKMRSANKSDTLSFPEGKYGVICADPPWRYEFAETTSRKIENQYDTMELDELIELPIADIAADDCVLFLWATSPKLREALELIVGWQYEYKTCMVWVKDKIGMGYYARQQHELLLIATRGKPGVPAESVRPSSVVNAPRTQHSAKPEEVYKLIEAMYPTHPRIELFARQRRENWMSWGNEVT